MRSREVVFLDVCCGLPGEFNVALFVAMQRRDKSLGDTSGRLVGT
jgi:hypothetical protein